MSNDPNSPDPSPERLAAFLDGELDPAAAARVVDWLKDNPAAAEEIDGQRALLHLWQENAPPEPGPAAWTAALARVRSRVPIPRPRRRRLPRVLVIGAGIAAAVVVAAFLTRLLPVAPPTTDDGPLPVIGPGDVTVISIDARDADGLVVAAPPVQEPLVLAGQDDVSVMDAKSYRDDGRPPLIGEGDVPIVAAAPAADAPSEP